MKKLLLVFILLALLGIFFFSRKKTENKKEIIQSPSPTETKVLAATNTKSTKFLFVPYWGQTAEKIPDDYGDTLIYFGITPNSRGIDTKEPGYLGVRRFVAISEGRDRLITIRMVDKDSNFVILKDKTLQGKIIEQTIVAAKENKFSGVILDLEISSLPFASVTDQMNNFVKNFSDAAKKENLSFSMMFYGDTFYRLRPYDTLILRNYVDTMFVMAYDFSKANGDPGPNFPLGGKDTYGYDFQLMVDDFLNIVPKEKLVIVFGMFGYDWAVDSHGASTKQAQSVTLTIAKKQFINQCNFADCMVKRDDASAETTVTYTDVDGNKHMVWFEDEDSVSKKHEYLKEKGINTIGYWAYSYF